MEENKTVWDVVEETFGKKVKRRIMNYAVWFYVIANIVLLAGTTFAFQAENTVLMYIFIGADVIVNSLGAFNNPDFKGMVKDKRPILENAGIVLKAVKKVLNMFKSTKDNYRD